MHSFVYCTCFTLHVTEECLSALRLTGMCQISVELLENWMKNDFPRMNAKLLPSYIFLLFRIRPKGKMAG